MDTKRFLVFYQCLNRIVKDIKMIEMSYMREYGLRSVHLGCLLYIRDSEKGMTVTQLANACKIDKALISRTVKELIADGFIMTNSSEKNYNKKYVLTQKSEEITLKVKDAISKYMARARVNVSEDSLLTFYEVLATLENNISLIATEGDFYGT